MAARGRPPLTLLERVEQGRFRPGRHARLLELEQLPPHPPHRLHARLELPSELRAWAGLVEWQEWYRVHRRSGDEAGAAQVAREFSRLVRYLHGGRRPRQLDWIEAPR